MSNDFNPLIGYMWFCYLLGGVILFLDGLVGIISSDNSIFEGDQVITMIFGLIIIMIEVYFIVRRESDSLSINMLYWIHLILGILSIFYLIIILLPFLLVIFLIAIILMLILPLEPYNVLGWLRALYYK